MAKLISSCPFKSAKVGRPKSIEKRSNILAAASELFLESGFSNTSMDMVASRASVSKQTVYSHFSNKDALFTAVIDLKCEQYQMDEKHMGDVNQSPLEVLTTVAVQFIRLMQDEQVIAMHRVVIGEVTSNPHVAELFYEAGPKYGMGLVEHFMAANQQLSVTADEAKYWSIAFFNLLKSDYHMRSLLGLPHKMTEESILQHAQKVSSHIVRMTS